MEITIKKLGPGDTGLAGELIVFFQLDDGIAEPVVPSDSYLRDLLSRDSFHLLVALQGDQLLGGLTGYELDMYKKEVKEMFLYEIAVKPKFRQQGIGKELIGRLKTVCARRGVDEMYVGTSTPNRAAMKLYSSCGGELVDDIAWFVFQIDK